MGAGFTVEEHGNQNKDFPTLISNETPGTVAETTDCGQITDTGNCSSVFKEASFITANFGEEGDTQRSAV